MKSVAVIPARGGSKGVPQKNIREINGLPLVAHTIIAAKESAMFDKIIVSTDSHKIAEISKLYGAEVPFIRPDSISGDLDSSDSVVEHALLFLKENGENYDYVCKLQPTSPLRTERHIKEAFSLIKEKEADFVVSFCECEHSPLWSGTLGEDGKMDDFMSDVDKRACRQELPKFYRLNGAIYLGRTNQFMKNRSFIGKNGFAYIMDQTDSIDIDSELDFLIAEFLMRLRDGV
ncbi:MAG: acylneuraminate cytidylyltransferase family protein [Butyrivibrio sp.]|uniref:acylneuraminate cytidylyltransferase family protein n=1 Tax=Butyrivibrio sp. TaxID=28121 RepID=UPI0025B984A7|nr:acylneuraminate cytidylyltransferase family protein [Butyrivibrio sp.]MBQ6587190.1 acylneuraminate cytidylyltransferase family protein [Butyrivibrio sp.]